MSRYLSKNGKTLNVLLPADALAERVRELAVEIDEYYEGREVVVVIVLKGAFIFAADLVRHIHTPITIDFIRLQSYGDDTYSSRVIQITADLRSSVEDCEVLVVEDIIDTGRCADFLINHLYDLGAADVKFCALLDKPSRREIAIEADWVGFSISDVFIVGYGTDFAQLYRNLPNIYILGKSV